MRKILFGTVLFLGLIACHKENVETPKDYAAFLAQTGQIFNGKLDGQYLNWYFGWGGFQKVTGYENGHGICDSTDPVRIVSSGLTSNSGDSHFTIYSPMFNTATDAYLDVFSKGKKKLGDFRTEFYLVIDKDGKRYNSTGFGAVNELEILKTEEFTDPFGVKMIRVWFIAKARLSTCSCQDNTSVFENGLIIAEFYGFRKGG